MEDLKLAHDWLEERPPHSFAIYLPDGPMLIGREETIEDVIARAFLRGRESRQRSTAEVAADLFIKSGGEQLPGEELDTPGRRARAQTLAARCWTVAKAATEVLDAAVRRMWEDRRR